jgi:hypothetical protein
MRFSMLFLVAMGGVLGQAQAYVLPADYLIRLMAETRRAQRLKDLTVHLSTTQLEGSELYDEHLYLKQEARLRRVSHRGEVDTIYVSNLGMQASGDEKRIQKLPGLAEDLTATLLMPGWRDLEEKALVVVELLTKLGIDSKVTSLGRQGEKIVYIVGARSWETDHAQIWIGKKSLLPMRMRVKKEIVGGHKMIDIRFLEYGSAIAGNLFPRVIEYYEDDVLVRRSEVVGIKRNQKLPDTLFDIP